MAPKLGLKRSAQRISSGHHGWSMDDPRSTDWFKGKPTGNHDLPIVLAIQDPWQTKTGKEDEGWNWAVGPTESSDHLGDYRVGCLLSSDEPRIAQVLFCPLFCGKVSDLTFQTFRKFEAILSHLVILCDIATTEHPLSGYGLVPSQVWVPSSLGCCTNSRRWPRQEEALGSRPDGGRCPAKPNCQSQTNWKSVRNARHPRGNHLFSVRMIVVSTIHCCLYQFREHFLSRAPSCTINSGLVLVLGLGTCGPMGTAAKALQLTMRPCRDVASAGGRSLKTPSLYQGDTVEIRTKWTCVCYVFCIYSTYIVIYIHMFTCTYTYIMWI